MQVGGWSPGRDRLTRKGPTGPRRGSVPGRRRNESRRSARGAARVERPGVRTAEGGAALPPGGGTRRAGCRTPVPRPAQSASEVDEAGGVDWDRPEDTPASTMELPASSPTPSADPSTSGTDPGGGSGKPSEHAADRSASLSPAPTATPAPSAGATSAVTGFAGSSPREPLAELGHPGTQGHRTVRPAAAHDSGATCRPPGCRAVAPTGVHVRDRPGNRPRLRHRRPQGPRRDEVLRSRSRSRCRDP